MNRIFNIIEGFVPETIEIMEIRYRVLRQVLHKQPVGRRQLSRDLGYSERTIRSEIEALKSRGVLYTTAAGIFLSPGGEEMLRNIDDILPFMFSNQTLAQKLKQLFKLDEVFIVPGDSSEDYLSRKDLGRAAARLLKKKLYPSCIVAVTGGSTLAEMANAITDGINIPDILIVPARGGLGEEMEQQAGAIAAKIARVIGAQYRLLHIPDNLEESTVEILKKDIHISEVLNTIKSSNILLHGIGSAVEMANRRDLSDKEKAYLDEKGAVGEALRYYFDEKGNIVYEVPGIGLELGDLENINTIIAIAGGRKKARAIEAVLNNGQQTVLITDEGAAKEIIQGKGDLYGS